MPAPATTNDFNFYMHDGPSAFSFEIAGRISDSASRNLEQAWKSIYRSSDMPTAIWLPVAH